MSNQQQLLPKLLIDMEHIEMKGTDNDISYLVLKAIKVTINMWWNKREMRTTKFAFLTMLDGLLKKELSKLSKEEMDAFLEAKYKFAERTSEAFQDFE